jgi:predicted transcriptional regulator
VGPRPDTTGADDGPASADFIVLTSDRGQQRVALAALAQRAGITPAALARQLGITRQAVEQYFRGRRSLTLDGLCRFVALCGGKVRLELPRHGPPS